jgi:PAS domain S-box-containing protein
MQKIKEDKMSSNSDIKSFAVCKRNHDILTRYLTDYVWILDRDFNITYLSQSIRDVFKTKDSTADTFLSLIHSFSEKNIKSSDKIKTRKWTTIVQDGSNKIWVEIVTNPVTDENGSFDGIIGIARDITKQKEYDIALQKSEEKFRTIFENTDSAISIQTKDKILLVNKSWENITGYTAEESKTLNPASLIHPKDKESIYKELHKGALSSGYQFHIIDKYGNEKWINISHTIINYEGIRAVLIVGSDITERKKSESELNKFSTGIMNSPLSIVITDIDGTIEYVNPFFTKVTGYTFEEAVGANPKILSSGNNSKELYDDLWKTILRGEIWYGEFQNKTKDGLLYWESARIAPIIDDSGNITSFIAIKEDVTERKRNLELIEQSEKDLREINTKKDKFFSIIAHDLRSPFSGVVGLIGLLKSTIKELDESKVESYLELIDQSAQNTFKLLENLLAWAKTQTGKIEFNPQKIALEDIVDEVLSVLSISAKNKNIDIQVDLKQETIVADRNMLNTVLRNLISNAIKYTNRDGVIVIYTNSIKVNNRPFVTITVEDNGVGIPQEDQNKIFNIEGNYSTIGTEEEKGTGLGLLLCKEFVEKHNGQIWCESEDNKGSRFKFTLPG